MSNDWADKMAADKRQVYDFWNEASCGENLYLSSMTREGYERHTQIRYELEPYILSFADFAAWKGKDVLEIGVGLGADHEQWARAGANLFGIDLTHRAIEHTKRRLALFGLKSDIRVGDAEKLPFNRDSFDCVYSWGVLHVPPDTEAAVSEVHRILRPGGVAKIMIYYKYSFIGLMLWLRYALLRGRPWTSLASLYAEYLESPGTKTYSLSEARTLFRAFEKVEFQIELSHGDLLSSRAGQRHEGWLLAVARVIWPRWIIRRFFTRFGLFLLVTAHKSAAATESK